MNEKEIRFIDLFGGIGGFRLGLRRANKKDHVITYESQHQTENTRPNGSMDARSDKLETRYNCIWYCDKDKYAVQTYNKNFQENYEPTDITTVNAKDIPDFDMLCAGFPCQSFSFAGKREGFKDTRGSLFFEICRIAQAKRPRMLFLENVKGLLSHDKGETYRVILESLDELGYNVEWQVLNSKNFGVPQNRERVFIVGHLRRSGRRQVFPIKKGREEAIPIGEEQERQEITWALRGRDYKDGANFIVHKLPMICSRPHGFNKGGEKEIPNMRFSSIQNELVDNIRRLTPVECERLQSFPDGWTKYGKEFKYVKLFGNIWQDKNVLLKDVTNLSLSENQNSVLNITNDGKSGELRILFTQRKEKIKENVKLKGVIELLTVENGVCDTINHGKDMVMLYNQKKTSKKEILTKKSHISEKMAEKSTYPLWKITLNENSKKEKSSIISILKKGIIESEIFSYVKTGENITNAIILWKKLPQNLLKKESLILGIAYTTLMSDTQRYKQLGNAVTVNVIEEIGKAILEIW